MSAKLSKDDFIELSKALFIAQNLLKAANPFSDFKKELKSFSKFYNLANDYGLENDGDITDIEECPSFLMDIEDVGALRNFIEECATKISWKVLAEEFAKQELGEMLQILEGEEFEMRQIRYNTIQSRMKKYYQEFRNNGLQNLRFRFFKTPTDEES